MLTVWFWISRKPKWREFGSGRNFEIFRKSFNTKDNFSKSLQQVSPSLVSPVSWSRKCGMCWRGWWEVVWLVWQTVLYLLQSQLRCPQCWTKVLADIPWRWGWQTQQNQISKNNFPPFKNKYYFGNKTI